MLTYVNFGTQAVFINDSFLSGVQDVSMSTSYEVANLQPQAVLNQRVFYKKPSVDLNITRFLSDKSEPFIITGSSNVPHNSGLLIQYYKIAGWESDFKKYKMDIVIGSGDADKVLEGGTALTCNDIILQSIGYKFETDGNFTESLTFLGHSVIAGSGNKTDGNHTGTVKRRHDFKTSGCIFPSEVNELLLAGNNRILKSVSIDIALSWNELPNIGFMNTYKSKYLALPIDITANISILDLGYRQATGNIDPLGNLRDDIYTSATGIPDRAIKIYAGNFIYDLGSGNYLKSKGREGANAGDSAGYTTYTFTYKNSNNYIKILRE